MQDEERLYAVSRVAGGRFALAYEGTACPCDREDPQPAKVSLETVSSPPVLPCSFCDSAGGLYLPCLHIYIIYTMSACLDATAQALQGLNL